MLNVFSSSQILQRRKRQVWDISESLHCLASIHFSTNFMNISVFWIHQLSLPSIRISDCNSIFKSFLGKRWHSWRALLNQVMIVSQNCNNILNQSAVGCRGLYYFQKLNRDPWSVEQQYYQMFCSISESFSVLGWNQLCDWSLSSVCIIPPKTILHINLFAKMVGWT